MTSAKVNKAKHLALYDCKSPPLTLNSMKWNLQLTYMQRKKLYGDMGLAVNKHTAFK